MIADGDIKLPEGEEFDSSVYDEFLEAHKAKERKILETLDLRTSLEHLSSAHALSLESIHTRIERGTAANGESP